MKKKYPKIYSLKYESKPVTVKQIRQKLQNDETILEYCNDGESYYCLSISKTNITYKICGSKIKTDALIQSYLTSVINKKADDKLSYQIYQILLPKTLTENLIISSDAALQQLSFDALKNSSSGYLINEHTVQYTFSANTYFNHQSVVKNKKIIAFYPDFTNTQYATLNNQKEHAALKLFTDYNVFHKEHAVKK